jgi:hypothetical protein
LLETPQEVWVDENTLLTSENGVCMEPTVGRS